MQGQKYKVRKRDRARKIDNILNNSSPNDTEPYEYFLKICEFNAFYLSLSHFILLNLF